MTRRNELKKTSVMYKLLTKLTDVAGYKQIKLWGFFFWALFAVKAITF